MRGSSHTKTGRDPKQFFHNFGEKDRQEKKKKIQKKKTKKTKEKWRRNWTLLFCFTICFSHCCPPSRVVALPGPRILVAAQDAHALQTLFASGSYDNDIN